MSQRHERGLTLVELLIVIAILGLIVSVAVPQFQVMQCRMAVRAAAADLRSTLNLARSRAVALDRYVGLRFTRNASGVWEFAIYEDGDRDGIRSDDIAKGTDRRVASPRVAIPLWSAAAIGLPTMTIKDPDGDPLDPGDSPVQFGNSKICSFSPLGESTSGTLYLVDRLNGVWAVRVYGATGKVRTLRYNEASRKWESR